MGASLINHLIFSSASGGFLVAQWFETGQGRDKDTYVKYVWRETELEQDEGVCKRFEVFYHLPDLTLQTSDKLRMIAHELNSDMSDWWIVPVTTSDDHDPMVNYKDAYLLLPELENERFIGIQRGD